MPDSFTIGLTAGSTFDTSIEETVFAGMDVTFRPVDIQRSADIPEKLAGVDAVLDRLLSASYTEAAIDGLTGCRVVARCGIGVDEIAVEAATRNGMYVLNVPSYCEHEVSEHAMLLVLALERDLLDYATTLREGRWDRRTTSATVHRFHGRTLGLVGFGKIARLVAEKAQAFGMEVVATDPYVDAVEMANLDVAKESFETVLEVADIVSAHTPLVDETRGLFDAAAFDRMKDTALFVNVARGGLVDEEALVAALESGTIRGAALDVFPEEPPDRFDGEAPSFESPLRTLDNVVLTPHVAWYSLEASDEKRRTAARDVRRVLEGEPPENAVNDPT
ncbi:MULTISPECIES: C-terminal binding protein [unclassified Haladaptatus]|uniref:C-terminal binding protein n=1 Tax=unclassified Haladaptatus TaxID=2622732 RepID=UPI0023E88E20|nr:MULTISPECIES: C-terminal binding protein [unclassified Haladaptatus]